MLGFAVFRMFQHSTFLLSILRQLMTSAHKFFGGEAFLVRRGGFSLLGEEQADGRPIGLVTLSLVDSDESESTKVDSKKLDVK